MAWIESHQTILTHPKTLDLASEMGWNVDVCIAKIHRLWWWCLDYAIDGNLEKHPPERIARAVGIQDKNEVSRFVPALIKAGLLDQSPRRIHDWWDYAGRYIQGKYSKTPQKWKDLMKIYKPECANLQDTCRQPVGNLQDTCGEPVGIRSLPYLTKPNSTVPKEKEEKDKDTKSPPPPHTPGPQNQGARPASPPAPFPGAQAKTKPLPQNPKPTRTPVQRVVRGFKAALEVPPEDLDWDAVYFPRYAKSAKALLTLFHGDLDQIAACIEAVSGEMNKAKLSWTPETIVKHASAWREGKLLR